MFTEAEYLFGLNELNGIGAITIAKIRSRISSLAELLTMTQNDIHLQTGIDLEKATIICRNYNEDWIEQRLLLLQKFNLSFLTINSEFYPSELRETYGHPQVIYYKGDVTLLSLPSVSIVGTRKPTAYGMKCATVLSKSIAAHGVTIVSGLAKGIDTYAHKAALHEPGRTIAVMATGFDRIYPAENIRLAKEIEENGLLISEMPLLQSTKAGNFPSRNRIIAGLGMVTIVVEASHKSGSLITSNHAAEFGRPVCVVPGNIFSMESEGTLKLLFDGAHPVGTAEHVFKVCGLEIIQAQPEVEESEQKPLNEDEKFVLHLLRSEPMSIDEIYQRCKFSLGHLHLVLLSLQMRKAVEALPGSYFISLK